MAQFIIYCLDKPDSLALRMANRPAHLDWARGHSASILMAGPLFAEDGETFAGSVFIIEADDLASVREWQASDPYVIAGLFDRVDIRPCRWVLGSGPRA